MTSTNAGAAHASEVVAVEAERRWAIVVVLIVAVLIAMMVFTSLHWASMPPSRVETIDPRKLHISGEYLNRNISRVITTVINCAC